MRPLLLTKSEADKLKEKGILDIIRPRKLMVTRYRNKYKPTREKKLNGVGYATLVKGQPNL